MSAIRGERVSLGQADGSEVELLVWGDEWYSIYETPEGYTAVYDGDLGLFTYAKVTDGRLESTGIAVTEPPPTGLTPHLRESADARQQRSRQKEVERERRAHEGRDNP